MASLSRGKLSGLLNSRLFVSRRLLLTKNRFYSTTAAAMPIIEQDPVVSSNGRAKAKSIDAFASSPYYNQGNKIPFEVVKPHQMIYDFSIFSLSCIGSSLELDTRFRLGLRGYGPVAVEGLDLQKERALNQLRSKHTSLDKYIFMAQLRNSNVRLFYKLVCDELEVCYISHPFFSPDVGLYYLDVHFPCLTVRLWFLKMLHLFFRKSPRSFIPQRSVRRAKTIPTSNHFLRRPVRPHI